MYAVIESGGKQYRVELGTRLELDRLEAEPGQTIEFERVLLVADGDDAAIGRPVVDGARVSGNVLRQARGEKIVVFKYKQKTRHRVKNGHRAELTVVEIADIVHGGRSAAEARDADRAAHERAAADAAEAAERQAAADRALADQLARAEAAETEAADADAPRARPARRRARATQTAATPDETTTQAEVLDDAGADTTVADPTGDTQATATPADDAASVGPTTTPAAGESAAPADQPTADTDETPRSE